MKNKKKIKVPAYAFGTELISNMIEALPEATTTIATPFQKSTATSGSEAFALSIADIGLGINTGMEIGKNFGAAGALVGGAIGAGVGLIGKGGRKASMSSFTDFDEGTLGTGLIGAFKNRRLRRERNRLRQVAMNNKDAVRGTNYLQNEYGEDYGDMDVNTFADGGYTSSLAYVDDGELIQTPDGTISKVPENNKPTDSNLVNLPEGSRILSDKLKVPGKKETFAQLGEKMMAKNKSKYSDTYALNAAKLNEINNNIIHDQLFAMQEEVKQRRGIKPKYKGIQLFVDGGGYKGKRYRRQPITYEVRNNVFGRVAPDGSLIPMDEVANHHLPKYSYIEDDNGEFGVNDSNEYFRIGTNAPRATIDVGENNSWGIDYPKLFNPIAVDYSKLPKDGYGQKPKRISDESSYPYDRESLQSIDPYAFEYERREVTTPQQVTPTRTANATLNADPVGNVNSSTFTGGSMGNLGDRIVDAIYNPHRTWGAAVQGPSGNYQWYHIPTKRSTTTNITGVNQTARTKSTKLYTLPEDDFSDPLDSFTVPTIKIPKTEKGRGYYNFNFDIPISEINADLKRQREWEDAEKDAKNEKTSNLSKIFSGIASLAPIMSNLFTGKSEPVNAVYNPYATAITNTMRRRRFNIDPAIEDTKRNRAISNYNVRLMNTSTGANLAYGLQSAINTDKAITNLRSMESNANNQYLGEYANTMNNLGQQWVNATNLAAEANAQNRATSRDIRRAGMSQLSQWAQNRELMGNQEARDNAMLALYGPFLHAGYTADTIREFNRWLNKGGNYVG